MLRRRGRRRACRNRQTTQLDNPRDYLERNEVEKEERKGEGRKRRRGKFVVVRGCRLGDSAREGREGGGGEVEVAVEVWSREWSLKQH